MRIIFFLGSPEGWLILGGWLVPDQGSPAFPVACFVCNNEFDPIPQMQQLINCDGHETRRKYPPRKNIA